MFSVLGFLAKETNKPIEEFATSGKQILNSEIIHTYIRPYMINVMFQILSLYTCIKSCMIRPVFQNSYVCMPV